MNRVRKPEKLDAFGLFSYRGILPYFASLFVLIIENCYLRPVPQSQLIQDGT